MGRGTGNDQAQLAAVSPRGAARPGRHARLTVAASQLVAADRDPHAAGDLIQLQNGVTLELEDGDPAATLRGLAEITGVAQEGINPNLLRVTFADGSEALVNLKAMSAAFTSEPPEPHQVNGAFAAAIACRACNTDSQLDDLHNELGNQFDVFRTVNRNLDDFDPEQVAEHIQRLAALGAQALEQLDGDITLGDPSLTRQLNQAATEPPRIRPRAAARARRERLRQRVRSLLSARGSANPGLGLIPPRPQPTLSRMETELALVGLRPQPDDLEESEEVLGLTKGEVRIRNRAAEVLGAPIPRQAFEIGEGPDGDPIFVSGEMHLGPQEHAVIDVFSNMAVSGRRALAFEGLPGTGKDMLAQQLAAVMHLPYKPINFGPKASLEDLLGGETLQPGTVRLSDGTTRTVTESSQHLGELGQALTMPCVVVIQEPEGKEQEFVRAHSILGDRVGTTEGRTFTVNSSSGPMVHRVHPDCWIIFTYNSNRGTTRFGSAFYDRVVHVTLEYPDRAQEQERYARMANRMFKNNPDMPKALRTDTTPEDVGPVVELIERARRAAQDDSSDILAVPGGRQGIMVYEDLVWAGWNIPQYETLNSEEREAKCLEVARETVQNALAYIYPHARMDSAERRESISTVLLADLDEKLKTVVKKGAEAKNAR